jgi:hypothetical protein
MKTTVATGEIYPPIVVSELFFGHHLGKNKLLGVLFNDACADIQINITAKTGV